ncbi:hypothetical protein Baya_15845 [Bagarius yarrelli]|uniref:Uncharacterized protein n=1 Tax=Bagarius yarrelli TaxID=175774 RepID=A0A556VCT8_BAGYA|nr:hypothetical protein Baya_15845 [Bagarius yarrelli]
MAPMTTQLILAVLLIFFNSAKPSPLFTEDRNTGELTDESSHGLQSETDRNEQRVTELTFYCDTESLIIGVSPTQYNLVYLLRDDGTKIFVSHLLKKCSHVELQSASLIRIFYRGCSFLKWLGQEKQYTVKLGWSHLNKNTIQTQTCPLATSGPVQLPDVKCKGPTMTVKLAAKELQVAKFINLDASSLQETILIEGDGLTQWTDGEQLVVQVENPMMEDHTVLWLQYFDKLDQLNMAKMFCTKYHDKHLTKRGVDTYDTLIKLDEPLFNTDSHKISPRLMIFNGRCTITNVHSVSYS